MTVIGQIKCIQVKWCKIKTKSRNEERKPFDANIRAIVAFREIGKGYAGLEKVCGYVNLPPPMSITTFNDFYNQVLQMHMLPLQTNL